MPGSRRPSKRKSRKRKRSVSYVPLLTIVGGICVLGLIIFGLSQVTKNVDLGKLGFRRNGGLSADAEREFDEALKKSRELMAQGIDGQPADLTDAFWGVPHPVSLGFVEEPFRPDPELVGQLGRRYKMLGYEIRGIGRVESTPPTRKDGVVMGGLRWDRDENGIYSAISIMVQPWSKPGQPTIGEIRSYEENIIEENETLVRGNGPIFALQMKRCQFNDNSAWRITHGYHDQSSKTTVYTIAYHVIGPDVLTLIGVTPHPPDSEQYRLLETAMLSTTRVEMSANETPQAHF